MNPYQPPSLAAEVGSADPASQLGGPFTSVFGLLGNAFSLYFGNLPRIAAITLAVFGPVNFLKCYLVHAAKIENDISASSRVEMMGESVFGSLVTAALLVALAHKIKTGRDLEVREALSRGFKSWGRVFGARFRAGLYICAGLLLLIVPGVIWTVKYSLTDEIAVLEVDRSGDRIMARSAELTQGRWWKIFAVGLLTMILVTAFQLAGGMVSGLVQLWWFTALVDCVTDVSFRFYVAVMLLVYLGSKTGARGAAIRA
ncbi:MAG: hypothetical protein ABJE95_02745 [Byssovorax sp.]